MPRPDPERERQVRQRKIRLSPHSALGAIADITVYATGWWRGDRRFTLPGILRTR